MTDTHSQHDRGETCPSPNCAMECDATCMARERDANRNLCDDERSHGAHGRCPGYVGRAGVDHAQDERRAAQIAAVLDTLAHIELAPTADVEDIAGQLVDAVNLINERHRLIDNAGSLDDHDRFAGERLQDPEVPQTASDAADGPAERLDDAVRNAPTCEWTGTSRLSFEAVADAFTGAADSPEGTDD